MRYDDAIRLACEDTLAGTISHPCRVLARGKMNTCLVEFEDGYRVTTSRNYVMKWETMQKRLAKRTLKKT